MPFSRMAKAKIILPLVVMACICWFGHAQAADTIMKWGETPHHVLPDGTVVN